MPTPFPDLLDADYPKKMSDISCSPEEFQFVARLLDGEEKTDKQLDSESTGRISRIAKALARKYEVKLLQPGATEELLKKMEFSDRHDVYGLACHVREKLQGSLNATEGTDSLKDHKKLTDFILFSQREFMLNLSRDLNRDNISFAQFFLLSYLDSSKELTMTDIAKKMGHSTAAATGLVDRLEKLGYMERTHSVDDRRKVMVRITSKGLDLISRLRDELQSQIADAMNESGASDFSAFISHSEGEKKSK